MNVTVSSERNLSRIVYVSEGNIQVGSCGLHIVGNQTERPKMYFFNFSWGCQVVENRLIHRVSKSKSTFMYLVRKFWPTEPKNDQNGEKPQIFTRCFLCTCKLILSLSVRKATKCNMPMWGLRLCVTGCRLPCYLGEGCWFEFGSQSNFSDSSEYSSLPECYMS